jgi:hypothetical protein
MEDWKTPEFWVTAVVDIAAAVIAVLSIRGLVSPEEGEVWLVLVRAIAAPVAVLVMAIVTQRYLAGQERVRVARIQAAFNKK